MKVGDLVKCVIDNTLGIVASRQGGQIWISWLNEPYEKRTWLPREYLEVLNESR